MDWDDLDYLGNDDIDYNDIYGDGAFSLACDNTDYLDYDDIFNGDDAFSLACDNTDYLDYDDIFNGDDALSLACDNTCDFYGYFSIEDFYSGSKVKDSVGDLLFKDAKLVSTKSGTRVRTKGRTTEGSTREGAKANNTVRIKESTTAGRKARTATSTKAGTLAHTKLVNRGRIKASTTAGGKARTTTSTKAGTLAHTKPLDRVRIKAAMTSSDTTARTNERTTTSNTVRFKPINRVRIKVGAKVDTKGTISVKRGVKTSKHGSAKTRFKPKTKAKENLLGLLRKFASREVKIPKEKTAWAKKMADQHLELIRKYCKTNSGEFFSHFEYTGSFYEHLKTVDADELDIMVALDLKMSDLAIEEVIPGYARLRVTSMQGRDKYDRFTKNGYLDPAKVRRWFFSMVQKTVNETKNKDLPVELKPSDNGPATTLVIKEKETNTKLSIDLVPAFLLKDKTKIVPTLTALNAKKTKHFVAKPFPEEISRGELPRETKEMLWRQSFSLEEKRMLENVDKKDNGCRRELIRIVKTILKKDSTLAKMTSYHIKSAFLHYNFDQGQEKLDWSGRKLPERFLDFLKYLRNSVKEKSLSNYFIDELNLLEELSESNFENIVGRLNSLIESEQERAKILKPRLEDMKDKKTSKTKPTGGLRAN